MRPVLLPWVVTAALATASWLQLVGCRATSTPTRASPTPQELCDHVAALQGAKSDAACVAKLAAWRAESPRHYACAAPCMRAATTAEAAKECFVTCPAGASDAFDLDAEATRNLGWIHTASVQAYERDERFCPTSAAPSPGALAGAAAKQPTSPADWSSPTWKCLGFSLEGSIAFQYEYVSNGLSGPEARYEAIARRRLPDGRTRTLRLQGLVTKVGQVVREDLTQADE